MDSTRLLDSRWALVAGTALSTAALCAGSSYMHSRRRAGAAPSTEVTKEVKDKKEDTEDEKRFSVVKEFYNSMTGDWETREEDDEDKSKLFEVKHRSWPKSADFAGHEDYTALEIHSQPLIDLLRSVCTEIETVFDDEPSLDSKDLFLHLDELKALLQSKKQQKERLAAKGSPESPEKEGAEREKITEEVSIGSELTTTDVTPADGEVKDDDVIKLAPPQTLEEVETEIDHFTVLLDYVEELFAPIESKLKRLLADGQISFSLLWAIFPPEIHAVTSDEVSGEKQAFKLKSSSYHMTRDGLVFELSGTKILWNGTRFARTWINTSIGKFKGMRKISSLAVHPLGDKQREDLTARGRTYVELAGVRFLGYSGVLIQVIGSGMDRRIVKLRAEGRAVVDTKSYRRMNPSRSQNMWDDDEDDFDLEDGSAPAVGEDVPEEELCLLGPTVYGFSLVCRDWGEMLVDLFSPISFSSDAWNHLELSPDYKDLIRSLVQQNSTITRARHMEKETVASRKKSNLAFDTSAAGAQVLTDVIGGKGGGLVMVLHGRPGVGKTLTAEAVSELLEAPLYSVTAGELGVQADQLEKRLRDTLDVSEAWGAVLLIDECDVFLQRRQPGDVGRNAMVSVFLRMLEYHSGVLFLTTNVVRSIDPAFLSRFSIAITYPDLSKEKRRHIWRSFLKLAGVGIEGPSAVKEGDDTAQINGVIEPEYKSFVSAKYLERLASKTDLNGRSIKNIVRTSQALAMSKNAPLTSAELDVVIKTSETFMSDFKEADEEGIYDAPGEGWKDRTNMYN